jgi:hypothetical protein
MSDMAVRSTQYHLEGHYTSNRMPSEVLVRHTSTATATPTGGKVSMSQRQLSSSRVP